MARLHAQILAEAVRLAARPGMLAVGTAMAILSGVLPLMFALLIDRVILAPGTWTAIMGVAAVLALRLTLGMLTTLGSLLMQRSGVQVAENLIERAVAGLLARGFRAVSRDGAGKAAMGPQSGITCGELLPPLGRQLIGLTADFASGVFVLIALGGATIRVLPILVVWGIGTAWSRNRLNCEIQRVSRAQDQAQEALQAQAAEFTGNFMTIIASPNRGDLVGAIQAAFARLRRTTLLLDQTRIWALLVAGSVRAVGTTASLGILWLGWRSGAIGPGGFLAAVAVSWRFGTIYDSFMGLLQSATVVEPAYQRVVHSPEPIVATGRECLKVERIELRDVWFRYGQAGSWILQSVNLVLTPSEPLILTWPSGAGKSTLIRLLLGGLSPTRGEVLVNGVDLRELELESYRARFGVLTQGADMLSGTIFDTLAPALQRTGEARANEAVALLNTVDAGGILRSLPLGLHTRLIRGGAGLSIGQTRRLVLARALGAARDGIVLDEPLAGLGESWEWLRRRPQMENKILVLSGHDAR